MIDLLCFFTILSFQRHIIKFHLLTDVLLDLAASLVKLSSSKLLNPDNFQRLNLISAPRKYFHRVGLIPAIRNCGRNPGLIRTLLPMVRYP